MSENILIELKNLTKRYGYGDTESFALKDFDLTIKRGEFIMIMGPSGCGKTTLLNIIGLLDRATYGDYLLNGENVANISSHRQAKLRAKKIGFIFQNFNLIENLPILENVALPLIYTGYSKTARLKNASSVLSRFHLQQREYYYPYQLSGGQQQRVAIARAIVGNPEIILADEPTGNLDSRSSHIVMEELKSIHEEGNTIIMVTHNPSLTTYATRVINMLDGHIDTDIKTVADANLPQPISVRIKRGKNKKKKADFTTLESPEMRKEKSSTKSEPPALEIITPEPKPAIELPDSSDTPKISDHTSASESYNKSNKLSDPAKSKDDDNSRKPILSQNPDQPSEPAKSRGSKRKNRKKRQSRRKK